MIAGGVGRDSSTFSEVMKGFGQYLVGVEHQLSFYNVAEGGTLGEFLGSRKRVQLYRHWSLDRVLFLNPLNDIWPRSSLARDTLSVPSHRVEGAELPTTRSLISWLKNTLMLANAYSTVAALTPCISPTVMLVLRRMQASHATR